MKYLAKNPKKIVMKMFRIGMTVKHVLISFQNIKGIQTRKIKDDIIYILNCQKSANNIFNHLNMRIQGWRRF